MSKPDDIPQDVWDAACKAELSLPAAARGCVGDIHNEAAVLPIARAIMAAEKRGEERERDRCAKLAEGFAGQFPEYPEFDEQHNCAIYIASVIRGKADVNAVSKNSVEG